MNLKNLFEKVNIRQPTDERTFLNFFNESVEELYVMFGAKYVTKISADKELPEKEKDEIKSEAIDTVTEDNSFVKSLNDKNCVYRHYHLPILYNILYLLGLGDSYKSMFLQRSEEAYQKVWKEQLNSSSEKKIIKRSRW